MKYLTAIFLVAALICTNGPSADAAFPGSNGRIAFFTFAIHGSVNVFTIRPTGGGLKQLTSLGRNYSPEWSADGSMIAFGHHRKGGPDKLETMSADGSGKTVVLANPPSGYLFSVDFSWSPDGSQIAFCSLSRKDHLDVFVVNSDGTGSTKIANGACDPSWSPLGGLIAISSYDPNLSALGIDTIAPNGTGRSRVVSGKNESPDWSPDGTTIVYSHRFHRQADLFLIGADGTGRTRLTSSLRRSDITPAFSPDGTKIVFSSYPRKKFYDDLFTIGTGGGSRARLTDTPHIDELAPSWRPI